VFSDMRTFVRRLTCVRILHGSWD